MFGFGELVRQIPSGTGFGIPQHIRQGEKLDQGVCVQLAAHGSGRVLDPHRWLMQQLVHDALGKDVEQFACLWLQGIELGAVAIELGVTDVLSRALAALR